VDAHLGMRRILQLALMVLLALSASAQIIMIQQVANSMPPQTPSGPTYQYIAAESGYCSNTGGNTNCTGNTTSISTLVNTVNGDLVVVNCQRLNTIGVQGVAVSDVNGETWVDEADLSPNNGATGMSSLFVALIANGGSGDEVSCTKNTGGTVASLSMTIDAFRSSSGWTNQGDGTPTDQGTLNYVLASPAGPCTVTASGATSQANELVYGSCFAATGTVSSASGYTTAQNNTFTSVGQVYTAYKPITAIQTPTFTTNGTLTDPQSLILTFAPN